MKGVDVAEDRANAPSATRRGAAPSKARVAVLWGWAPVVPSFVLWLACFVAPVLVLLVYSFGQTDFVTYRVHLGWTTQNYTALADSFYLKPILRSLLLATTTTVLCAFVSFPVAYYLSRKRGKARVIWLAAIVIPYMTSFIVRAYAWLNLLAPKGPIGTVLTTLGLADDGLQIQYTPTAVSIVLVYAYLPLMILPIFVVLDRHDFTLNAAASDLGASGWRTLRRVTLPLAKPGIYAGCLLVFIPALGEYTVPAVVGGGKTLMFGNIIAEQFQGIGDYSLGAALSASLTAIVVLCVVLLRSRSATVTFRGGAGGARDAKPSRKSPFLAAWAVVVVLFLLLPITTVFVNAFNSDQTMTGWDGFTFHWFDLAVANDNARSAAVASVKVAIACVLLTLAITVPAGLWSRRASRRGLMALDVTNYVRIALPEVVFAVGLFILFRQLDLPLGLWGIVLGHVVLASAFALVIIQARLVTMDTTLEQAASDLGAPPRRVFRRVTLPLIAPAVVGAGLLAFFVSADNVLTSLFMGAGTEVTLPVYILSQAQFQITPETNAIAVLFVVVVFVVVAAVALAAIAGNTAARGSAAFRSRSK